MTKSTSPKLVGEFNKNANETIRVQLTEYDGKQLLDIRIWVQNDKGDFIPTHKGISLRLDLIDSLQDALLKAAEELEKAQGQG